ncbi:MAG TPA: ABC transporter ATP-binding protein [Acidimicrobiales bacterium]|nr:ABC transporter ATP-binding protein [Acidimicrobiales bacterium]
MPSIDVSGLVVRYPAGVVAVDGLTFTADAGEVLALLGPNGAGKTTTVETLEGYKSPTSGTVRVLDLDPVADHARLAPRIGVMLQKGGVYPGIRPDEALRLFASFYESPEEPAALLDRLGLAAVARTPWRRLSGGEQQRLSLALALVGRPEVAFLDEPTAGVDVSGRQVIREVIAELRARGCCVLLATHELDEAERVADRVVIVDHGRLLAEGTPAELMSAQVRTTIDFGAPAGLDTAALAAALGAPVVETRPGEYSVAAEPAPATVAKLTAWLAEHDLALGDLRARRQSLEDVFLRLTSGS